MVDPDVNSRHTVSKNGCRDVIIVLPGGSVRNQAPEARNGLLVKNVPLRPISSIASGMYFKSHESMTSFRLSSCIIISIDCPFQPIGMPLGEPSEKDSVLEDSVLDGIGLHSQDDVPEDISTLIIPGRIFLAD